MGRNASVLGKVLVSVSSMSALWVHVPSLFIQHNVTSWNIVNIYKNHKFSSFEQIQSFFKLRLWEVLNVKTNMKNFINKRRPTFHVIYLLLQHKNWKRWTQFLFININHYVCLWLILSCKIDMLLTTKSQSLFRSVIFKKYKWEICKKEITMQWLKINFFSPPGNSWF